MPPRSLPARLYYSLWHRLEGVTIGVATEQPVVALTFDDGPHPLFTPRLLDILERHGARGTFFMVGQAAARFPDVVQRVAAGGHAIGNHTWDHPSLPEIGGRARRAQIRQCARAVAPYGHKLLRPPFGHLDRSSHWDAAWLGYRIIAWNVVGYDWLDHDATWLSQNLLHHIRPGCIVLLHDAAYVTLEQNYVDRALMLEAVDIVLAALADRYRFMTVPDLLRCGRPQLRIWRRRGDPAFMNRLEPPTNTGG